MISFIIVSRSEYVVPSYSQMTLRGKNDIVVY